MPAKNIFMNLSRNILLLMTVAFAFGTLTATAQNQPQMQGHRGLDFSIDAGPDFMLNSGGATFFRADIELGKKFNKNFYFGVSGGIENGNGATYFPIVGKFRTFLPSYKTKVLPYIGVGGGYSFGDFEAPMVELVPGVLIPISPSVDLNAGVGYTASFPSGGGTLHYLGVRLGLNIHKSTAANSVKKPWAPTRERGLQYVIDASTKSPWSMGKDNGNINVNIAAMYKYDNNISFGAGLGFGGGRWPCDRRYSDNDNVNPTFYDVFLRGKYRLNEEKISPFASVDVGMRMLDDVQDSKSSVVYVTPAVGLSFKVAGNSYIDVRLGYEIGSSAVNESDEIKAKSCNGIAVGVSFTHTMNILTGSM